MAANLEAKSLSSLNFLAANPPQYPVNPTEEPREPLVLYISRVPGTRDVILSTFKPQVKNVTAADVANSLYYVHLDVPADELLAPPVIRDEEPRRQSGESARGVITRKPLPPTATIPRPTETADPGQARRGRPGGANSLDGSRPPPYSLSGQRGFVEPSSHATPEPAPRRSLNYPQPISAPIHRKPLGPRPLAGPPVPEKDYPRQPNPQPMYPRPNDHPIFRADPFSTTSAEGDNSPINNQSYPQNRSPSPKKYRGRRPSTVPFSLTLIRRDPASGHQWNVGKISSVQANSLVQQGIDPSQPPQQIDDPSGQPKIDIHIENSGYAKFRGMPTLASIDALRSSSSTSLNVPPSRGAPPTARRSEDAWGSRPDGPSRPSGEWNIEGGFTRQVAMTYSKTWAMNLRKAFQKRERPQSVPPGGLDYYSRSQDPNDLLPPPPPPREPGGRYNHMRHDSAASFESFASHEGGANDAAGSPPKPLITEPGPGLKPKGYVFTSPWEGLCEFRTGNAGRSLKCQHVLQPRRSSWTGAGGTIGDLVQGGHDGPSSSKLTSELRFNLPSSDLFAGESRGDEGSPFAKHRRGRLSRLFKLDQGFGDGSDGENDQPMGLSLGRERAGGGNRGARVKLGKLIVHDEGLKMLDLVVAANVGVWWVAWEKAF